MRRGAGFLLAALLIVCCMVSGCGTSYTQVSGRVLFATSRTPVPGVLVRMAGESTRTAADGIFAFERVRADDLEGTVEPTGTAAIAFNAVAGKSTAEATVKVPEALVHFSVSEAAVEPQPLDSTDLQFDGHTVSVAGALSGVVPGKHQVQLDAPGHMPFSLDVDLGSGVNTVTIKPSLTPTATYDRMLYDTQYGRPARSYRYILPAERKLVSLAEWSSDEKIVQMTSYKLGKNRVLSNWTSQLLKRRFSNVVEIDRTYTEEVISTKYSDYGHTYHNSSSQHWVLQDGIWYMVHEKKFW